MDTGSYLAVIKVVGIGGGGTNAVNRMVDQGLKGVEFIAVNTDAQALQMCDADIKLKVAVAARVLAILPTGSTFLDVSSPGRPVSGIGSPPSLLPVSSSRG